MTTLAAILECLMFVAFLALSAGLAWLNDYVRKGR